MMKEWFHLTCKALVYAVECLWLKLSRNSSSCTCLELNRTWKNLIKPINFPENSLTLPATYNEKMFQVSVTPIWPSKFDKVFVNWTRVYVIPPDAAYKPCFSFSERICTRDRNLHLILAIYIKLLSLLVLSSSTEAPWKRPHSVVCVVHIYQGFIIPKECTRFTLLFVISVQ